MVKKTNFTKIFRRRKIKTLREPKPARTHASKSKFSSADRRDQRKQRKIVIVIIIIIMIIMNLKIEKEKKNGMKKKIEEWSGWVTDLKRRID